VTYTVVWRHEARRALARLRADDLASAKLLTAAIRPLADDPYPTHSSQLGSSRFWRLRLADLRVLYEADDTVKAVYIYSIGRVQQR
jgi:mRNA-degrading endonuclease RelE of RelBE toxin-antitoxin system